MAKVDIKFPKPLMTVKELCQMGFSETSLRQYLHSENAQAVKCNKGKTSQWLIVAQSYLDYLCE